MLTEEQIKNLKPGDPLIINATFGRVDDDGDVWCDCNDDIHCFSPRSVSLPPEQPKHAPCRPFKEGDVARVVERFGRKDATQTLGALVTVTENDFGGTFVCVKKGNGAKDLIAWCFLELVTPVEELEPYTVDECGFAPTLYVRKNGKVYMTIPYKEGSSLFQTREEAKAAAEAECDRLNAEYRKEHGYD